MPRWCNLVETFFYTSVITHDGHLTSSKVFFITHSLGASFLQLLFFTVVGGVNSRHLSDEGTFWLIGFLSFVLCDASCRACSTPTARKSWSELTF